MSNLAIVQNTHGFFANSPIGGTIKAMDELKDIPGFRGRYAVTKDGRVWSYAITEGIGTHHQGKWLKSRPDKDGYGIVYLSKNSSNNCFRIHRLLAQTYISNPFHLAQVNHINGVKNDNRIVNLEWCTPSENARHAYRIGLHSQAGEKNAHAILKERDIKIIKERRASGETTISIAKSYGIHHPAVSRICSGKRWSHVQ